MGAPLTNLSTLPKTAPEFLLDTEKLNKRLAATANNPRRWLTGSFHASKGMSRQMFENMAKEKVGKWVEWKAKEGWVLDSKPQVFGPFRAYALNSNLPLLGNDEFRVRAVFKTVPKPIRTMIDPAIIKQAPDHTLTRHEAVKAWGMESVIARARREMRIAR